ncbi:BTAD domain-containing putative transcriptional regulator [Catellatospora sp. NPDC049609]|uniref:AfsR/SARP family transcriptional regulator n=1 Tax=Catellatospora sp. NPDC049609 TaxID=3155505 RepID=UPI003445D787
MPVVFRLLGPLALGADGGPAGISVPKIRCMLAVLLLDADQVVSLDRLSDELWGEDPPRSAVANLRSYASVLRRTLTAAGLDPDRLVTTPGGYRLLVHPGERDVDVWRDAADDGLAALAAGRPEEAARRIGTALACWRGPALADVPAGAMLSARATALDELRVAHTEELFEARLLAGEGTALVVPLREHLAAHPTRERAYEQLMRVHYGAGDTASALDTYRSARRELADRLGLEPGPGLRRTHSAVLRRDPALAPAPPAPGPVPRQLPPDTTVLVGRDGELAALEASGAHLRNIHGPGGVGKSALALRLAHRLAPGYPDGQLYLDLLGSSPRLTPLSPAEVLGRFLRALGTPEPEVPSEQAEAAALFRSHLATRRMIVVLDNAVDAAQVRPLLPGGGGTLVLVTSRRALSSLDGAFLLPLDVLRDADAALLLDRMVGARAGDARSAAVLAKLCGGLPLALRIAAARLVARPDWSAADLVDRLVDEQGRLDELHIDDMAVRSCFHASYRALDGSAARAFRMAGLARVPRLSAPAVAAMLDLPRGAAAAALDRLVDARLLEVDDGAYRLHDLLRLYAAECAFEQDDPSGREAALHRLLVYYVTTARRAVFAVYGLDRPLDPALDAPAGPGVPTVETPEQAGQWLDAELPSAYAVAAQAAEAGPAGRRYPANLLRVAGHYVLRRNRDEGRRLALLALAVHDPRHDPASEALARVHLGQYYNYEGRFDEAYASLTAALSIWRRLDDADGLAAASNALGNLCTKRGAPAEGLEHFRVSLDALRRLGNRSLEAAVLNNVAELLVSQQRYAEAVVHLRQALAVVRGPQRALVVPMALCSLGVLHTYTGDVRAALRCHARSLALARAIPDPRYIADVLLCRSETYLRVRRPDLTRTDAGLALHEATTSGDPVRQGAALRQIGKAQAAVGDRAGAAVSFAQAARLFQQHAPSYELMVETFLAGEDPALPRPPRGDRRR